MHLTDPIIVIVDNSVPLTPVEYDITASCTSCTLSLSRKNVGNQNTFGVKSVRRALKGLWDGSVQINLHSDFAADGVSTLLWEMLLADGESPYELHITAADEVVSATNPTFVIPVTLDESPFVDGSPGEIAAHGVTFQLAGVPSQVTGES